jgi:sulfite reductase beta subunit-like hemoprotein
MPAPDIPAAKRSGLTVDLDRLARDGDGWLTAENRYALKTYGVCAQLQPGVFMIRCRIPSGRLTPDQLFGMAEIADEYAFGWLHLTTRQNVELHHVSAVDVGAVLAAVEDLGLTTRSACGHTMRNVMACPDAGVGVDEPFDCGPDARRVSDAILARSSELNCRLPSRINIAFGGCPACRHHARLNDAGFESIVTDGEAGYRLWAAGSLGTMPFLAMVLRDFVPRRHILAAAEALVDLFVSHGDVEDPKRGRMKFVVEALGEAGFRSAFAVAFDEARSRLGDDCPPPVGVLDDVVLTEILRHAPLGGWERGVRPQRTPGLATVTIRVPLGDIDSDDARRLATLPALGDGFIYLTRDQNLVLRDVPVGRVPEVRIPVRDLRLSLDGADATADIRACTGSAVCSLGITRAPAVGDRLRALPALVRNAGLRVHVSGCPNSCAQHQAGDIGLSGAKVRVGGRTRLGYRVWLGADLEGELLAEVAGRAAEEDVERVVTAVVGMWEAMRRAGEPLGRTVRRVGLDAFAAHLSTLADGFEPGADEPELVAVGV